MRVAILADYPVQSLPGFDPVTIKKKPAFWLPPLSLGLTAYPDLDVHWLFTSRVPHFTEPLSHNGQTFHCVHITAPLRSLRAYLPDSRALMTKLDTLKPDLVHAWGTETPYPLAALRSGRPFLVSMQGLITHYIRKTRMSAIFHLLAFYERYVFRRTAHATVDSSWGAEIMREWMPLAEIREIVCAVQPHFFAKSWIPDKTKPVAVFVGTIDARKGIRDLVKIFADARLARFELWVIGEPFDHFGAELQRISGSNIHWLGDRSSEEVADALSRAWCLVLPTRADTCPTVVKEARVVGLPVVTTPEGGQRDFITDRENGYIVTPGDQRALTEALLAILGDYDRARRMGSFHRKEQLAQLSPKRMGESFARLYRELVDTATSIAPARVR